MDKPDKDNANYDYGNDKNKRTRSSSISTKSRISSSSSSSTRTFKKRFLGCLSTDTDEQHHEQRDFEYQRFGEFGRNESERDESDVEEVPVLNKLPSESISKHSNDPKRSVSNALKQFVFRPRSQAQKEIINEPVASTSVKASEGVAPTSKKSSITSVTKFSHILRSKPKNTSHLWTFFTAVSSKEARCNICLEVYKTSGNTTNMKDHMMRKHRKEFLGETNFETDPDDAALDTINELNDASARRIHRTWRPTNIITCFVEPHARNSVRKKRLDMLVAMLIAEDFQPLSIVENRGFRNLVTELDRKYEIPSRWTLTNTLLPECWSRCIEILREKLRNCSSRISLSIDGWTSQANESYLGITCHFIEKDSNTLTSAALDCVPILCDEKSESLAEILEAVMTEWNIRDRVICLITDNAKNMVKVAEILKIEHMPCLAHSLNLVIKNSLKDDPPTKTQTPANCDPANPNPPKSKEQNALGNVQVVISICKDIVTFFHSSPKATRILNELKNKDLKVGESPVPGLVQQVDTRWNTVLYMMQSVINNYPFIKAIQMEHEYTDLKLLKKFGVSLVNDLINILEPFEVMTKKISGENYPTISIVIPYVKGLITTLQGIKELETEDGRVFARRICRMTQNRLLFYEKKQVCRVASIIDPRFKKKGFWFESNAEEAVQSAKLAVSEKNKKNLSEKVAKEIEFSGSQPPTTSTASTIPSTQSTSVSEKPKTKTQLNLLSYLEDAPGQHVSNPNANAAVGEILVSNYLTRAAVHQSLNPLKYWNESDLKGTALYDLVQDYFSVCATSVPVERMFSRSGYIVSDRRNRLSRKNVTMLTFLNLNIRFLN